MDARREGEATPMKNRTTVERTSERELVVRRTFNAPARIVFEAWTKPELFKQWWAPKSMGMFLRSCEMDVRVGGRYRLVLSHAGSTMEFFGRYLEVTPHSRLVWTNDEADVGEPLRVAWIAPVRLGRGRALFTPRRGISFSDAAYAQRSLPNLNHETAAALIKNPYAA